MILRSITQQSPRTLRRHEQGYVLITMLLAVALMTITAAIAFPAISFEIRRDREQEMVHRGVQYSRAIRVYYKKFGRYPTKLEDLDNTNNLRYLRKHYKDPINGQDFKLLHYGEPGVTLAGGIAGGSIPGANAIGTQGGLNNSGGFSQPSTFGGNANNAFGNNANSTFGGNGNNAFGANSNAAPGPNSSATNPVPGTDPSQDPATPIAKDSTSTKTGSTDDSSSGQLVASGPIVGVASTSKKATIREFNKKKKYNEWQFVYDPSTDRGGLITTPNQPNLQSFGSAQGIVPGQNGQPGNSNNSPFGQPAGNQSGFGNQSSPFGNNPNSNAPTTPPSNPQPPQQQ
jgi:type II secretory pathway pseudopilin PulG